MAMKGHNLLCVLLLCATAVAAPTPEDITARMRLSQWLTARTGHSIAPAELLVYPKISDFANCVATGLHRVGAERSELRLHCRDLALPQLVVLSSTAGSQSQQVQSSGNLKTATAAPRYKHSTLVHSGMQMHAELRSDGMRAVMFVVALDNGDAGETIRVRVAGNSHTLHAQIVDAHSVVIVNGGA